MKYRIERLVTLVQHCTIDAESGREATREAEDNPHNQLWVDSSHNDPVITGCSPVMESMRPSGRSNEQ